MKEREERMTNERGRKENVREKGSVRKRRNESMRERKKGE